MARTKRLWTMLTLGLIFALMLTVGLVAMPQLSASNGGADVAKAADGAVYSATWKDSAYTWEKDGVTLTSAPTQVVKDDVICVINETSAEVQVYTFTTLTKTIAANSSENISITDTYDVVVDTYGTITLTQNLLTLTATGGTVKVKFNYKSGTVQYYKKDETGWTPISDGTTGASIDLTDGQYVKFSGTNVLTVGTKHFAMSSSDGGTIVASGDVTSLTNGVGGDVALAAECYKGMFKGCTILTKAPALPSTTLGASCYSNMFNGCISLTSAPALPATTLANSCYMNMFDGCTSLIRPADIPKDTALAEFCCNYMYKGCTGIAMKTGESSNGFEKEWKVEATEASDWNTGMFTSCGDANCCATSDPTLNTSYYVAGDIHGTSGEEGYIDFDTPITAPFTTLATGNYYLANDIVIEGDIAISGTVNICLNDNVLNLSGHHITNSGTLTIYDCGTTIRYFTDTTDPADGCYETYSTTQPGSGDYLTITGGVITGGYATSGGAIYNTGTLTINGGSFVGNTATRGGAIYIDGTSPKLTIKNGTISGNTAQVDGGAIYNGGTSAEIKIENGTISGNTAPNGGAIYNNGASGTFTISGGSFVGNTATGDGGGVIDNDRGTVEITGGTFGGSAEDKNTAVDSEGGAIYNHTYGILTITGGTISYNEATNGGGIINMGTITVGGSVKITDNTATGIGDNLVTFKNEGIIIPIYIGTGEGKTPVTTGDNKMSVGITIFDIETESSTPGAFATCASDYSSCFTSDNGDYTVAVSGESSYKDSIAHVCNNVTFDNALTYSYLEGLTKDTNSNTLLESGNYVLAEDITFDDNINNLIIASDKTVNICLNGHVLNLGGAYNIQNSGTLTIYDCGTTIRYFTDTTDPADGCYETYSTTQPGSGDYLTITGGVITGGSATNGGAIYNTGTLTINGGSFVGNKATNNGGAILNTGASANLTINDGTFAGNTAQAGGAINNNKTATLEITGGIISNNTATMGGAISNESENSTITGGTISNNTATMCGGILAAKTLTVGGTVKITGNTATQIGANLIILKGTSSINIGTDGSAPVTGTTGMKVGITILDTSTSPYSSTTGDFATCTINTDYSSCFTSDSGYFVKATLDSGTYTYSFTADVDYIDEKGSGAKCSTYTKITSASTALSEGWYIVDSDVTVSGRITCTGAVNIILMDGYTFTASSGITVSGDGNSLTIYGQSDGDNTGKLVATGTSYSAGIGGVSGGSGDNITICGGDITATGGQYGAGIGGGNWGKASNITITGGKVSANGGMYGAGIGGGHGKTGTGNEITISGGTVTATGGEGGAGIGGGHDGGSGTNIKISGGTVTAIGSSTAYSGAAGIGGGANGSGSDITISGGKIEATGGVYAAGIGGGEGGAGSNITISGGDITATGGTGGAGIGGGANGSGSYIEISGTADVTAQGGDYGAGIGGGQYCTANNITITGGTVSATGGDYGAGIGGGRNGSGSYIEISGTADVTAQGGDYGAGIGGGSQYSGTNITISGGTVTATGGSSSAGIGGGNGGSGSDIKISGGTVTATGGYFSAGIGGGSSGSGTNIKISGGTVTATAGSGAPAIGAGANGTESSVFAADKVIINAGASKGSPMTQIPHASDETNIASSLSGNKYATTQTGYVVYYKTNAGDETVTGMPDNMAYLEGAIVKVSTATPVRAGYTFVGWNGNKDATTAQTFTDDEITIGTDNVTLYAIWEENSYTSDISITVTGDIKYGTKKSDISVVVSGTGVKLDDYSIVSMSDAMAVTEVTAPGTYVIFIGIITTDGKWFKANNGAYLGTVTVNSSTPFAASPGSTISYGTDALASITTPENSVYERDMMGIMHKVTLTGYTLTYDKNAGEDTVDGFPTDSNSYIIGQTVTLDTTTPVRTGYKFLGWGETAGATSYVTEVTLGSADKTIYAIWEALKNVSITESVQTKVYSGVAQGFDIDGTDKDIGGFTVQYYIDSVWTTTAPTNAGTYNVKITRAEDANYNAYSLELENGLKITQYEVTVTAPDNDFTYDGSDQGSKLYAKYTNVNGDVVEMELSQCIFADNGMSADFKNAGNYYIKFIFKTTDETTNYSVKGSAGSYYEPQYTMKQFVVGINWNTAGLVYDGTAQMPTATATGLFGTDTCTVTVEGEETDAGTGYVATATELSNANYKLPESATTTFAIDAKEVTLEWSAPESLVYDGTNKLGSVTVTGLVDGDSCGISGIDLTGDNKNVTEDGFYFTVTALDNANYKLPENADSDTLYITAKEVELEWTNTALTYNGSAQKPSASVKATSLIGSDTCTVTAITGEKTNAGSYTATATTLSNANYKLGSNNTSSFEIAKKEVELEWTNTTLTYNGSAQKPTASVKASSLIGSDSCTVTVSGEETNAGTYTATAASLSNANYKLPASATQQYTIGRLAVAEPSVSGTYTYTGKAQTVSVTGVESFMSTLDSLTKTDAGTYTINYTVDANHTWAAGSDGAVSWTIAKATNNAIALADDAVLTKAYDGNPLGALPVATATFGAVTCDMLPSAIVNAGKYNITYSVADTANYNGATKTVEFIVTKAQDVITINGQDIVVVEGTTVTIPTATSKSGTAVTCDKTPADLVAVGTYTITYTVADSTNYLGTTKTLKVTVQKKEVDKDSSSASYTDETKGFDPDVTLVIEEKETASVNKDAVKTAVAKDNIDVSAVYDVALIKNGTEVSPDGTMKVSLALPDAVKTNATVKVVSVLDDGTVKVVNNAQIVDGKVVFEATELTSYAIIIETVAEANTLSGGAIAGIVIGIFFLLLLIYLIGARLYKKNKLNGKFFDRIYSWVTKDQNQANA